MGVWCQCMAGRQHKHREDALFRRENVTRSSRVRDSYPAPGTTKRNENKGVLKLTVAAPARRSRTLAARSSAGRAWVGPIVRGTTSGGGMLLECGACGGGRQHTPGDLCDESEGAQSPVVVGARRRAGAWAASGVGLVDCRGCRRCSPCRRVLAGGPALACRCQRPGCSRLGRNDARRTAAPEPCVGAAPAYRCGAQALKLKKLGSSLQHHVLPAGDGGAGSRQPGSHSSGGGGGSGSGARAAVSARAGRDDADRGGGRSQREVPRAPAWCLPSVGGWHAQRCTRHAPRVGSPRAAASRRRCLAAQCVLRQGPACRDWACTRVPAALQRRVGRGAGALAGLP